MAKDLSSLIRLESWRVDEKRRRLGEFLRLLAEFEERRAALADELRREQSVAAAAPAVAGFLYGSYARSVIERRAQLARSIARCEDDLARTREELRDTYRDLKKFEVTAEGRRRREREMLDRLEQVALDEIALQSFRQRGR